MTHTGRDHWNDMNPEQRARLIRDMPMVEEDHPSGRGAWPALILGLIVFWALIGGVAIHIING